MTLADMHAACKLIEVDGAEAYFTCVSRYGSPVANLLLVAHFRRAYNPGGQWPEPRGLEAKVERALAEQRPEVLVGGA